MIWRPALAIAAALQTPPAPPVQRPPSPAQATIAPTVEAAVDSTLRAAVERFFETQQREDSAGYMALWSQSATGAGAASQGTTRPTLAQLQFVFDSGDDIFSDVRITAVTPSGSQVRVRVEARRERTVPSRFPDVPPRTFSSTMQIALAYEREGGEWRLLREGPAADDLAVAMLEAPSDEARDALLAAEPNLGGLPLVFAAGRLGTAAAVRQDYRRALIVFTEMARLARRFGHPKEEGEALQSAANALYYLRRFPEALAAFERRLAIERARADPAGIGAALTGIATIRYSLAEYTEALARYREAIEIFERMEDVAGLSTTTLSIGNIGYLQGDFAASIAAYRRSFELSRSLSHADGEALALEGLGRVYTAQGDYGGALAALDRVLNDPRLAAHVLRLASAAQQVGDVHLRLGNLDAAKQHYEASRLRFETLKDLPSVGQVLQSSALVELVAGRFATAEALYTQAASTCLDASDKDCAARATAGLGYARLAQGKYRESVLSYRAAVQAFETLGAREGAGRASVGLAQALTGAGDLTGAIAAATDARHAALVLDNDDLMWRALTAEARAVRRAGDGERAMGVAGAAVSVVETMQAELLDTPGASVPAEAGAALTIHAVLQAERGDATGAFATSEKLRVLEVRAGLATNERDIARGMTPEERDQERALAAQQSTLRLRLAREKGLPKQDAGRIAAIEAALAEATAVRRPWIDGLYARLPDLRDWRGLWPPPDAAAAAPLLDQDGALLVSIVMDEEALLVITAARQPTAEGQTVVGLAAHVTDVPRRVVADRIASVQQLPALSDLAAWRTAAAALTSLLPQAVRDRMTQASRLMVIPHDSWWRVPFAALPSGDGAIIDHATVALGGSLYSLLRSHGSSPVRLQGSSDVRSDGSSDNRPGPLVAFGAPQLTAARLAALHQMAPAWAIRTAEAVAGEMRVVAGQDLAILVTGEAATERAARERAPRAAVLHLATPFRINAASPLFSPLLFATSPPPSAATPAAASATAAIAAPITAASAQIAPARAALAPENDGTLELREIANLELSAGLAVLSDGVATSMRDGAAAIDVLQWGWLAAGVPTLVITRWNAPVAAATEQLLAALHQRVQQGEEVGVALRKAQLALRTTAATAAPVHWAGWMTLGSR